MPNERERLTSLLADCHDDPDLFNTVFLRRPPYWWRQVELCEAVVRHRVVCVESGNAVGKDFWVAGVIAWWLSTRPDSLVIVTGPSQTVLGSVTWKEIRRAFAGAPLLRNTPISEGIKASPQTVTLGPGWQALGYSTTNVERASGQHAGQLLVVVEEASGVDDAVWEAIDGLKYTKLIPIGNPLRADGGFVDLIEQAEKDQAAGVPDAEAVCHINIPSTDSPDADKAHSKYGLADRTWLDEQARKHGKDSLWYRSHVLAIRPKTSHDTLIPVEHLDWASRPEHAATVAPFRQGKPKRWISCDVGEGVGRARTVIIVRDDWGILELHSSAFTNEGEAAAVIAHLQEKWQVQPERISYDGAGATGKRLGNALAKFNLHAARPYFGSGSGGKRATNLRTACAMALARRLDPDHSPDPAKRTPQPPFHIPAGEWWPAMREELLNLRYQLAGDKSRLEDKDDFMARLGRSPDYADALCQSFREDAIRG